MRRSEKKRTGALSWVAPVVATTAIAACLAVAGCAGGGQQASSSQAVEEVDVTEVQVVDAASEFVGGNDPLIDFAANSSALELTGDENACYSPASYFFALAMVGAGADGQAQEQLLDALGVDDAAGMNEYCRNQLEQIAMTDEDSTIAIADSLWSNTGYRFQQEYVDAVSDYFGAGAFDVEFGTDQTMGMIRDWISDNTRGLLSPDVQTDAQMVALLVNTLYFKDMWIEPFVEGDTATGTFAAPSGEVDADFMHALTDYGTYIVGTDYTAAQMPFAGGSTCTFYLPNEGVSVADLLATPDSIQEMLLAQPNSNAQISWAVPRFKGESAFDDLVQCAQAMGITDIFDATIPDMFRNMIVAETGADLSFYISDALQETSIDVNEFGVEAAAYTAMSIRATSLAPEPQEIVEFTLDRPFAYVITASNGAPLFVGVVTNPAA